MIALLASWSRFSLHLQHPSYLFIWLLLLLLACSRRTREKRGFTLWLVVTGLVLLVLAQPSLVSKQTLPRLTIFCVDRSGSLSQKEKQHQEAFVKRSIEQLSAQQWPYQILVFTTQATWLKQLAFPHDTQPGTNITSALRLAWPACQKHDFRAQLVICSDASAQKLPSFWLQRYQKHSVPIHFWSPPKRANDWQALSLKTPISLVEKQQVPLTLSYQGTFAGTLDIQVQANERPYLQQQITVLPGKREIVLWGKPLAPGEYWFTLKAQGDVRDENNILYSSTQIQVAPHILYLGQDPEQPLLRALEVEGFTVESYFQQDSLPVSDYGTIIVDQPSQELLDNNARFWANYLSQDKGILVVGGNALAPWYPAKPVQQEPKEPKEEANRPKDTTKAQPKPKDETVEMELRSAALVFLIDSSGSMVGEKLLLAQQSALASIARLWQRDKVGVIAFSHEPQWIIPLNRSVDINWTARRLQKITPGGGTNIAAALEKAYQALINVSAQIKHVILLSDGRDEQGIFAKSPILQMTKKMQQHKISITTIGVGDDFDAQLMPQIARISGGKFYFAGDYQEIPAMMLRDVDRVLGVRKPPANESSPPPEDNEPVFSLPELPPDNAKSQQQEYPVTKSEQAWLVKNYQSFPTLPSYQKYTLRPGAQLEMLVAKDPLLVHWRWGLGKVMLWNAPVEKWQAWPKFSSFWARLLAFLQPTVHHERDDKVLITSQEKREQHKILVMVTVRDPQVSPSQMEVTSQQVDFKRIAPLEWQAEVLCEQAQQIKEIQVEVQFPEDKLVIGKKLALSYHREYGDLQLQTDLLQKMAQATKGQRMTLENHNLLLPAPITVTYSLSEVLLVVSVLGIFVLALALSRMRSG